MGVGTNPNFNYIDRRYGVQSGCSGHLRMGMLGALCPRLLRPRLLTCCCCIAAGSPASLGDGP